MMCKKCLRILSLPAGLICIVFSLLQDKILPETGLSGFMQGFLFGIGIGLVGYYLIHTFNREKDEQDN